MVVDYAHLSVPNCWFSKYSRYLSIYYPIPEYSCEKISMLGKVSIILLIAKLINFINETSFFLYNLCDDQQTHECRKCSFRVEF